MEGKSACVVVLGDLGRSPRTRNHAYSLALEGADVRLIGYSGSALPEHVAKNEKIKVHHMTPFPDSLARNAYLPKLLLYVLKTVWQCLTLFWALTMTGPLPHLILVQNPPSIPTLPVAWFVSKLRWRTKLVIDWHNYGYTILAMSASGRNLAGISRMIEAFFGSLADCAFCVSKAMKDDLHQNKPVWPWAIDAEVLYDKPADEFRSLQLIEKHRFFVKFGESYPLFQGTDGGGCFTAFTEEFANERVEERADRPALLISSTSWTEDEDFSVLFEALQTYEDERSRDRDSLPELICCITGRGPLKAYYCDLIAERSWSHVTVLTPWLEPEDYPKLLACGDLGVCLHTSSSGVDLPMKVVDMFGACLPVAAFEFPALSELVVKGRTGMTFTNTEELAEQILDWFRGFPTKGQSRRKSYFTKIKHENAVRWRPYWRAKALPHLLKLVE